MPNHANRLVIDARKLGDGGIGAYIESLVDGLVQAKVFEKIQLIVSKNTKQTRWLDDVELIEESAGKYSFAEYFLMPIRLRSVFANSVVHFPHYTVPFFLPKSAKVIVTIHDCIHLNSKNLAKRIIGKWMIGWAIKRADRVITVSSYSKEKIIKYFPNVQSEKIDVIPNSIPEGFKNSNIKPEYFLFVGNGKEHKGLDLLISNWSSGKLLIVGADFSEEQLEKINSNSSIVLVGKCSRNELIKLYSGARALIMPSLEEGFGIPVLEALSIGVPVIATPVPCFLEWFGDSPWYTNRFDTSSIRETISLMLANPELTEKKVKLGIELAANFSLVKFTKRTLASYEKVESSLLAKNENYIRKVA